MIKGSFHHSDEARKKMSIARKGRHLSEEHKKKMSIIMKGNKRSLGYKHSEETKRKMSEIRKGYKCSEEMKQKIRELKKGNKYFLGKQHSEETKRKISEAKKCEKNSQWKNGVTPIVKKIRKSLKYNEWRQNIFIRDNFTCQKCGDKGGKLIVHHKKSFTRLIEETKKYLPLLDLYDGSIIYTPMWDINNGITLCEVCHRDI